MAYRGLGLFGFLFGGWAPEALDPKPRWHVVWLLCVDGGRRVWKQILAAGLSPEGWLVGCQM